MFYCFLAPGFEEIEAITTVDMLRRAGIQMKTVAVTDDSLLVCGAHGVEIKADLHISDAAVDQNLEGVFLPGGMPGTTNLDSSQKVRELVSFCAQEGRYVFAICAAPMVLGRMGLLCGKKATCYPGFEEELKGAELVNLPAVADGRFITGKGPGATVDFASLIITELKGAEASKALRDAMQCHE
ncbi:MAG: DJ-1/PfpI family protein [Ruminococcus sp.]|nr:DJ-1/PfpI family protein [Ruminococcus sp.]